MCSLLREDEKGINQRAKKIGKINFLYICSYELYRYTFYKYRTQTLFCIFFQESEESERQKNENF